MFWETGFSEWHTGNLVHLAESDAQPFSAMLFQKECDLSDQLLRTSHGKQGLRLHLAESGVLHTSIHVEIKRIQFV